VTYRTEPPARSDPGETAEELARLAAQARNPAERIWYLQWARAFRQLAVLGRGRRIAIPLKASRSALAWPILWRGWGDRSMSRPPKSLDDAKQIFREERAKVAAALSLIAGSRWLLAIAAALTLTFGSHLIYAPDRLPALEWLHWQNVGLPPSVDFGLAGEQWDEMRAAAERQDVAARAREALAVAEGRYVWINAIAFAAAFGLLALNLWVMTKRRRTARG
jgi:hypothetical protein